jgi:hypothetical protein
MNDIGFGGASACPVVASAKTDTREPITVVVSSLWLDGIGAQRQRYIGSSGASPHRNAKGKCRFETAELASQARHQMVAPNGIVH